MPTKCIIQPYVFIIILFTCTVVCYAPLYGQVDCGSGLVDMGVEGDHCNFSCDHGYLLQGRVTSGTCENTGNWSRGLPNCAPLHCSQDNLPVPANAVLQFRLCGLAYRSQCTVSCNKGFTGGNITYLCNVTSDPTKVDWVTINGTEMNDMCKRGLLPHYYMHLHSVATFLPSEM